ncbi:Regulator of RNase E activity RraA [Albimonas donghaensis]|uniref:Regulator of RNase E activity RraA n=1 Tax=Albimonas donghaensis TaxID=356660 RepID=A0A1H3ACA1_9RHOB|nr:ribonuclease activity regulator RraA [Albimonas donghaensis]SDX27330.1 Regulator of RNase E activity RraA [Albimonas donghaensis]
MNPQTRDRLMGVTCATLTTALYKRGLRNVFLRGVGPVDWKGRNMVGPAFTLRYIPAREDRNGLDVFRNPDHPQRVAIETCPEGHVLVIDSRMDATAASAGDILVRRLMKRGGEGVVTDGGFRDSPAIGRLGIPAYHQRPSAPTNLVNNEAVEINGPIGCGGVAVFPGDVIVGDGEGVAVIPAHLADEIAEEAEEMTRFETFVAEQVDAGRSITGIYPPTDPSVSGEYAAWRDAARG